MVYIGMKRERQEELDLNIKTMANCLMLLSRGSQEIHTPHNSTTRVFQCKTCNRQFPSFQALGGHRASHKKPRLAGGDLNLSQSQASSPAKPKTHECSICGLEFAIGQALGGHMRRHRASLIENGPAMAHKAPIVKKAMNSRRIMCLDLNLTPYENDYLEFSLGKRAPTLVDFYL